MTSLLRRPRQSKHEVTIDWQIETFCCITISPSPAPMIRPTQVAHGDGHLPPALLPRAYAAIGPGLRELVHAIARAPGIAPSEWLIMYVVWARIGNSLATPVADPSPYVNRYMSAAILSALNSRLW